MGNTQHTLPYMLKHSDLFDDLPEQYHDSAFLDRLHCYIPGWEVDIIRGEMFSNGYGFVVDYLAEILRNLRTHDYSHLYREYYELFADISERDRTAIQKTFSGFMKILYPHREAPQAEIEEILRFAIEGRKRVKDQLLRIDKTYPAVRFGYRTTSGQQVLVKTLEEELYPHHYGAGTTEDSLDVDFTRAAPVERQPALSPAITTLTSDATDTRKNQHLTFQENQRGVTYDSLFGAYLQGAQRIVVTDPYIRLFYQARNFMEFLETVAKRKSEEEEVSVHLVTIEDEFNGVQQQEYFAQMQVACAAIGITLSWEFDGTNTIHARHIITDTGWKIALDRGLDIFQRYEMNDAFAFANRLQQYRTCKAFEMTILKIE